MFSSLKNSATFSFDGIISLLAKSGFAVNVLLFRELNENIMINVYTRHSRTNQVSMYMHFTAGLQLL